MKTPHAPDITRLLEQDYCYAVLSTDGQVITVSEAGRKTLLSGLKSATVGRLEETSLAIWTPVIVESVSKAQAHGEHTEDIWYIDSEGNIRRFIHRYQYHAPENVVTLLWFETHDRLNMLLKSYDRKRKRFGLWNGSYITVKELRTIAYYVQGLSYKAIARQENISAAAVSARLQTIAQKTGFDSVPMLHTALFDELYRDSRLPKLLEVI